MHRILAFAAGAPVGVLGALAWRGSSLALEVSALAGGALLLLAVAIAGRFASPEAERGHLTRAACIGFTALPAAAAAWLGLAPGAGFTFGVAVALLILGIARAMRASGSSGGPLGQPRAIGAALGLGTLATVAAAGGLAAFGAGGFESPAPGLLAESAHDVDANVALGPDFGCEPKPASSQYLGAGARPVLGEGGAVVWFDAESTDGRRQIYRLLRASGARRCWTCGEPGDNRRPRLAPDGTSIVFETNRHVTAREPVNWELHLIGVRTAEPTPSRRLTYDPAPDTFGDFAPHGGRLLWSSGGHGRFTVAVAELRSDRGGLVLGKASELVAGGAAWVAPLGWAPDARTLVTLRGDPFGLQEAAASDPATGKRTPLGWPGAHTVAASFSADGSRIAVATTRPAAATAALPEALGFLVARLAALGSREPTRFRVSGVRIGPSAARELAPVALGEIETFGYPTGLALEPDGRAFVLGQRGARGEERLVRIELFCPRLP